MRKLVILAIVALLIITSCDMVGLPILAQYDFKVVDVNDNSVGPGYKVYFFDPTDATDFKVTGPNSIATFLRADIVALSKRGKRMVPKVADPSGNPLRVNRPKRSGGIFVLKLKDPAPPALSISPTLIPITAYPTPTTPPPIPTSAILIEKDIGPHTYYRSIPMDPDPASGPFKDFKINIPGNAYRGGAVALYEGDNFQSALSASVIVYVDDINMHVYMDEMKKQFRNGEYRNIGGNTVYYGKSGVESSYVWTNGNKVVLIVDQIGGRSLNAILDAYLNINPSDLRPVLSISPLPTLPSPPNVNIRRVWIEADPLNPGDWVLYSEILNLDRTPTMMNEADVHYEITYPPSTPGKGRNTRKYKIGPNAQNPAYRNKHYWGTGFGGICGNFEYTVIVEKGNRETKKSGTFVIPCGQKNIIAEFMGPTDGKGVTVSKKHYPSQRFDVNEKASVHSVEVFLEKEEKAGQSDVVLMLRTDQNGKPGSFMDWEYKNKKEYARIVKPYNQIKDGWNRFVFPLGLLLKPGRYWVSLEHLGEPGNINWMTVRGNPYSSRSDTKTYSDQSKKWTIHENDALFRVFNGFGPLQACHDTAGRKSLFTKGTVTETSKAETKTLVDSCVTEAVPKPRSSPFMPSPVPKAVNRVYKCDGVCGREEFYCENDKAVSDIDSKVCTNGCEDGACLPVPPSPPTLLRNIHSDFNSFYSYYGPEELVDGGERVHKNEGFRVGIYPSDIDFDVSITTPYDIRFVNIHPDRDYKIRGDEVRWSNLREGNYELNANPRSQWPNDVMVYREIVPNKNGKVFFNAHITTKDPLNYISIGFYPLKDAIVENVMASFDHELYKHPGQLQFNPKTNKKLDCSASCKIEVELSNVDPSVIKIGPRVGFDTMKQEVSDSDASVVSGNLGPGKFAVTFGEVQQFRHTKSTIDAFNVEVYLER